MDNMKHRRLQELDRSDFEIIDGEPDIRGWDVKNSTGQKIGEVEELIVDAKQKKVRYMVVDLDDNELKLDHRKVLLPIGMAQLHEKDDDVILPQVNEIQLRGLPTYDEDHLDAEVERNICNVLGRTKETTTATSTANQELPEDFYTHEYYNADNLYKNRMHEATPSQKDKQQSEYEKSLKLW
jgi:sporulation protein YlmC with PRC-barrel domain